eukprot:scaffold33516_cov27-Tisochrysis_lutea.AAC.2
MRLPAFVHLKIELVLVGPIRKLVEHDSPTLVGIDARKCRVGILFADIHSPLLEVGQRRLELLSRELVVVGLVNNLRQQPLGRAGHGCTRHPAGCAAAQA